MSHLIPVAQLDEIPPGKGKTLLVEGREVTVYNEEGRLVATANLHPESTGVGETTCAQPGHHFDTGIADSRDRLRADEVRYEVRVRKGTVFVVVEDGFRRH